ncbi:hypothetical protein B484DRAFT_394713 [Ochromonadaceae sp. CCMP2298]|nr:hypothetical protein B484DRAFT_394713 [Ochromonadaceae sp. CCMP2298]
MSYVSALDIQKLRGSARVIEKTQAIVAKIKDKVTELQFNDITDPHLVQSVACCIQSTCNRKNKKHPIDKHEILCQVLEAIKKSPLTPAERATVLVLAQFCLDNGLVRGVPLWRLVIQNVAVFAKKKFSKKPMDILTRIADAEAAEKADREERAAEYFRLFEADLDEEINGCENCGYLFQGCRDCYETLEHYCTAEEEQPETDCTVEDVEEEQPETETP